MDLILFDIDQTLIKRIINESGEKNPVKSCVFEIWFERKINWPEKNHGRTHKKIIQLAVIGSGFSEVEFEQRYKKYLDLVEEKYSNWIKNSDSELCEGALDLLSNLKEKYGLGLVTGNIELVADEKIKLGKLNSFFNCGGFGDFETDRSIVVEQAIKNCQKKYNSNFETIYYVGDAINDIVSAKNNNLVAIGITTGIHDKKELKSAGADYVFGSLVELNSFFRLKR